MTSSTSIMTFAPHQPSPLARALSPLKDPPPPPPSTPTKTAKLWDEYEKRAVENARRRETTMQAPCPQRSSGPHVVQGYQAQPAAAMTVTRSSLDFKSRRKHMATPSTTVAICKTCQQPITYSNGICERCMKRIILLPATGETTPPLSPSARNFASTDLQQLHRISSIEEVHMLKSTSPKRKSFCPLPSQLMDPPIRLSSLRPPPPEVHLEPNRARKTSLTDPNEPFLRLQTTRSTQSHSHAYSQPATPTTLAYSTVPTTPPSTSHSQSSTRPSSLATAALLPTSTPPYTYARNLSATPSDLSALYALPSTPNTSPASLSRVNYALQNTTSAWDDWDSDSEEEKVGLVGWMGRKRGKSKVGGEKSRWSRERARSSKDSFATSEDDGIFMAIAGRQKGEKSSVSREEERLQRARRETLELVRASGRKGGEKSEKRGKARSFVRVISCGCSDE
ncbi:hypothetical protein IQ07DRAFT_19835 [Pyrenochaeta sp. DS3sAY3a]|nr:hypothetical protein IQ07DRAFT_19835 [Pyrenochaeta sp. DS3sAY3a]